MKEQIKGLDFLRGIAALAVVIFHFGNAALLTLKPNYLTEVSSYGKYGVQIFFVISGFIIPYSMYKSKYRLSNYFNNLLRRFVRINPPSYVAILLSFAIYFGALWIIKRPIQDMIWPGVNLSSIFGNLTYTVPFLDTDWFNPFFWTLAIEFQFYFLIGLLLPILMLKKKYLTLFSLLIILALGFVDLEWFFQYGSFFVFGMLLFLKREKLLSNTWLITLSIVTVAACFYQRNLTEVIFGFTTFLIILSGLNLDFKAAAFLGRISYSLYITHWAVGIVAEIILKRVVNFHEYPLGKVFMIFVYTGIAIVFAAFSYKFVEKPFIIYSKRIKAKVKKNVPSSKVLPDSGS